MIDGYYIKKIGQNRGAPRVWLEGTQTQKAGFEPGQRFDIVVHGRTVVLQANPDGSRVVSGKKEGEKTNPVIDINSKELLAIFDGMSSVRVAVRKGEIFLLPLASELKKQERFSRLREKLEAGDPLTIGSLSHGGGVLSHAIHTGLKDAGVESKLAFANEIREELLEHAAEHNDAWSEDTKVFAAPMQELAFDERGVASIPKVEVLEAGLPCSGASRAGRAKRGLTNAEAHPEVGHLVVSALVILSRCNPACVVLENVPTYASTGSADILRSQLKEMGYVTHERLLRGSEWGALEDRTRWVMVAVTEGIEFDFNQLRPPAELNRQKLADVIEAVPDSDPRWSRMQGLKDKEVRDAAAGKGFKMQVFDGDSEAVGTMTKGYSKVRSTDPKLAHPTDPNLLRQFTPAEHAAMKQIPSSLVANLSATIAHQVLGQSIVYEPFRGLGAHIGDALTDLKAGKPSRRNRQEARPLNPGTEVELRIASLAAEVVGSIRRADCEKGVYSGRVVAVDEDVIIQDVGMNAGVVHARSALPRMPRLGESVKFVYERGQARIAEHASRQLTLGL